MAAWLQENLALYGHAHLFGFENDFVASLRCVPMATRFKLDRVGIKLSLRQWSQFLPHDRRYLLLQACETPEEVAHYREAVVDLVFRHTGEPPKPLPSDAIVPWDNGDATPDQVACFARHKKVAPPSDATWRSLATLQRFVLLKLSRDNHDNENFVPALKEFGIYTPLDEGRDRGS